MTSARSLFRTWLPTALGSSMLVVEIPVVAASVARSTSGAAALAAFGICIAVVVVVNTPALALTPLVVAEDGRRPRAQVWRLTVWVGVLGTTALLTTVFGPVFDPLSAFLDLPEELRSQVRGGLLGLAVASFAVAVRRYQHGRLIVNQRTQAITSATLVRIALSGTLAWLMLLQQPGWGALGGGLALSAGAFTEAAVLAHALRALPEAPTPVEIADRAAPHGRAGIIRVHLRLSGARLLNMAPQLVTTVGIARSQEATPSLVVWPVLYGMLSLLTGPTMDLESVTAAGLGRSRDDPAPRVLTWWLAIGFLSLFAIVLASPLHRIYLQDLMAVPAGEVDLGLRWVVLLLPVPTLWVVRSYLRGVTLADGVTEWMTRAVVTHAAVLTALVVLLALSPLPGIGTACIGLLGGILAEVCVLACGVRSVQDRRQEASNHRGP